MVPMISTDTQMWSPSRRYSTAYFLPNKKGPRHITFTRSARVKVIGQGALGVSRPTYMILRRIPAGKLFPLPGRKAA